MPSIALPVSLRGQLLSGSRFSPLSLFATSEPGVWYDPSDLTTMFQDTAGTTPVTTPGQTVARINDKSGRGNNATQATAASRPTYGIVPLSGRRNLLTFTEQLDDAAWVKTNATVTANTTTAPNGTTTADSVLDTAVSNIHYIAQDITSLAPSGKTFTVSAYAKANTLNFITLGLSDVSSGTLYAVAVFNLSTGAVSASGAVGIGYSVVSSSISAVGDGWYRCVVTVVVGTVATFLRSVLAPNKTGVITAAAGGFESYLGNGSGIYAWGAQLELGSTATEYQRVGTAFDVTEAGVQSLSYLSFDGVDDSLVTPSITPGVDKLQVFAGLRKLSDAVGYGILAETGGGSGTFTIHVPYDQNTGSLDFTSRGTSGASATVTTGYAAPLTTVMSGLGDISGDRATLRLNGTQVAQNTGDQGTGNYLANAVFIGRRAGTSLPFNGNIYQLIIRFGANLDAGTISSAETFINGKTGAY